MKITKALDKINDILEQTDYKCVYIELKAEGNIYTLDKNKQKNSIGFKTNDMKGGE